MKTALTAITGAAIGLLLSLFFMAFIPVQAEPASDTGIAVPADAAEQDEVKHVGMGENQPL